MPFLQALTSLAATLALLVGAAWLARHYGGRFGLSAPRAPNRLKVVESLRLNTSTTLYMVSVDGEEHLIASSGGGTTLLTSPKASKKAKVTA